MGEQKLSAKEAALIEAARRELARPASPASEPSRQAAPKPGAAAAAPAAPAPPPSAAERIAALMEAERDQTRRRNERLRLYGVAVPSAILIAALLWAVIALWLHIYR